MSADDANLCPVCQRQNKRNATECAFCGEPLQSVITIIVPEKPIGKTEQEHLDFLLYQHYDGLVLFVAGQKQPIVLKNVNKVILGRGNEISSIPVLDLVPYGAQTLGVSRQHALIESLGNGRYAIEDRDSTNGTFVNETRLKPHTSQTISNGDMVRLGQLILFVYYRTGSEPVKPTEQTIVLTINPLLPEATSPVGLTMSRLQDHVTPFLHALAELQYALDTIRGKLLVEMSISSLTNSQNTAEISIGVSGAADAIQILREAVLPWRRKYGVTSLKATTELETAGESDAPDLVGDETMVQPSSVGDPTISSEALATHTRQIIQHFQDELIPAVMTQIGGNLTAAEEDTYRERLSPHLRVLSLSPLELLPN